MPEIYRLNDFLVTIGTYDYHIIAAIPEKTTNIATMVKPYDVYIWAFIGISTIAVMLTMISIERISGAYKENYVRSSIHQCKCTYLQTVVFEITLVLPNFIPFCA